MHVHGELNNLSIQSLNDLNQVVVVHGIAWILEDTSGQFINESLNGSCPVDVQRNIYDLAHCTHHDFGESFRVTHLNYFLA